MIFAARFESLSDYLNKTHTGFKMKFIQRFLGREKGLMVRTELIKAKIFECLGEGLTPVEVLVDNRLAGWELLSSKKDALLYIKYIRRRMGGAA